MIASMIQNVSRFFKRTYSDAGILHTDLHSHLIPGIDDGAKTMRESLELLRALHALGYRKIITTPHTMPHRYPNDTAGSLEGLGALRRAVSDADIALAIDAASEYYLDEHFMARIRSGDLLTFGDNEVLFEMSYIVEPPQLDAVIFEMQSSGYTPVLAHPERYLFMHETFGRYEELKTRGVRFQVNINSLGGFYSKAVQKTARKIMDAGWIDYLGSDTHHRRHIDALTKTLAGGVIDKVLRKNRLGNSRL